MTASPNLEAKKKEAMEAMNRIAGRKFREEPRGMTRLVKSFTTEEIENALKTLVKDPWHKERIKELSSDYLLRVSTIDRWLEIYEATKDTSTVNRLNDEPLVKL